MTVNELIETLQEIAEDGNGEAEVQIATQPTYPLKFELAGVAVDEKKWRDAMDYATHDMAETEEQEQKLTDEDREAAIESAAAMFEVDEAKLAKYLKDNAEPEDECTVFLCTSEGHPSEGAYASKSLWENMM